LIRPYREVAKTANLDPLSLGQGIDHGRKDRVHNSFGILLGKVI
jgi:hypothetical protein